MNWTLVFYINISITIAFIIFLEKNMYKIFGFFGELYVKKELKKLPPDYKILNNIMLKTNDQSTHQIDHIVVSKFGIFVIETKHLSGHITGNDYDKTWIKKQFGKKSNINNPVHQNYSHIMALCEVLNLEDSKFTSIICITSNAIINVKSNCTVDINKLLNKIKSYNKEIINDPDVIYNQILSNNIVSIRERKKHVNNVKKILKNSNKCPLCNGDLIIKNGVYGKFLGCSNYPNCKYSKKLK